MRKASVGMSMVNDKELIAAIKELDKLVQFKVVDNALKAGAKPVNAAMKVNAPDSRKTGSRKKQSRASKTKWSGSRPLRSTIRTVVRKQETGAIALVGPSYSEGGGHGNLFSKDHKRKVLWGRGTKAIRQVNRFVKHTADQTAGAAKAAIIAEVRKEIDVAAREVARRSRG
jgi:hypothetical protein